MPTNINLEYVVVSPVKDEERFVRETLEAMVRQTVRPTKWVIVDDGSRDGTSAILEEYREKHDWIVVINSTRAGGRGPGSPVVQAFNHGYEVIRDSDWDLVVKLDCDLRFREDYFEELLKRFREDPTLGIASGVYLEDHGGGWEVVPMPPYHTMGACKVIRKACFQQIGGFLPARGWDTVDEIRAQMNGWKTVHFPELKMHHLKLEGSGIGFVRTNMMHGEIYYKTGGGALFFLLKFLHRIVCGKPFFIGALVMGYAYGKCHITRQPRIVSKAEGDFYRSLLNGRIFRRAAS